MPNWCINVLSVTGAPSEAKALRALASMSANRFDFSAIVPMPREVEAEGCPSRESAEATRRDQILRRNLWRRSHWGTPWPADNARWMSHAGAANRDAVQAVHFLTVGAPPIPVIVAMSARFPSLILRLDYHDEMTNFFGFVTVEAGRVIAEKEELFDYDNLKSVGLSHDLQKAAGTAVYIGSERTADARGPAFARSQWANPFTVNGYPTKESVRLYRDWLLGDPRAAGLLPDGRWRRPNIDDIAEQLLGRTLVCDCLGDVERGICHGAVLSNLVFGRRDDFDDYDEDDWEVPGQ